LGFVAYSVPDEFLDALPDEELAVWEGNMTGDPAFAGCPGVPTLR